MCKRLKEEITNLFKKEKNQNQTKPQSDYLDEGLGINMPSHILKFLVVQYIAIRAILTPSLIIWNTLTSFHYNICVFGGNFLKSHSTSQQKSFHSYVIVR